MTERVATNLAADRGTTITSLVGPSREAVLSTGLQPRRFARSFAGRDSTYPSARSSTVARRSDCGPARMASADCAELPFLGVGREDSREPRDRDTRQPTSDGEPDATVVTIQ